MGYFKTLFNNAVNNWYNPFGFVRDNFNSLASNTRDYGYDDQTMPEDFSGTTEDWQQIVANNPYSYANFVQSYGQNPTALENIASNFGIRSNYDKLYGEWRTKSAEYFADVLNSSRAEDYNSESSTLARQRAAGLNPDINGTIANGSEAVPANGALGGLSNESANAQNNYETLFQGVTSVAMQVMQLQSMGLGAEAIDIGNMDQLMQTATTYADKFADIRSIGSFLDSKNIGKDADFETLADEYLQASIKTASDTTLSSLYGRKSRKKVQTLMDTYVNSADYKNKLMDQMRSYVDKMPQAVADKKTLEVNDFGELISQPLQIVTTRLAQFNTKKAEISANLMEADLVNSETNLGMAEQNQRIFEANSMNVEEIQKAEKAMQKVRSEGRKLLYDWLGSVLDDKKTKMFLKLGAVGLVQVFDNSINNMTFMDLLPKSFDFSRSYDNSTKNSWNVNKSTIQN